MRWLFFLLLSLLPAKAERLVVSLSTHRVIIQSNFTGSELVLFGLIEGDATSPLRRSRYDVIVNVRGENLPTLMREKQRVLGLFINHKGSLLPASPLTLLTVSSKKLDDIVNLDGQIATNSGIKSVLATLADNKYRNALLDTRQKNGAYREISHGVTFVTSALFRARVPVPSKSPTGNYEVEVLLYSGGLVVAKTNTNFEIVKSGVEAYLSRQAYENSLVYGLAMLAIALFFGLMAHLIFRRD